MGENGVVFNAAIWELILLVASKVFFRTVSYRSLLIGLLLVGLGWLLLLAADTTDASVIAPPTDNCMTCHTASLITFPTIDPCAACHEAKNQPKLANSLQETWQQALELKNTAPAPLRHDARYQTAIHELETASQIEKYAVQETTFQRMVIHLTHAQQLLAELENEVRSGHWVSGQKTHEPSPGLNIQTRFQPPDAVKSELLFVVNQDIPCTFLNESLNSQARFLLYFTVQRRGPPSDEALTDSILLKRRLPSMQSLFYFIREISGRDRSASPISFFL